jgi:thioesterase domain-containing protein
MSVSRKDSAMALVAELQAAGITLWRKDGDVHFRGPRGLLTPEVLLSIKEKKYEILPLLPHRPDPGAICTTQTPNVVCLWAGSTNHQVFCIHAIDGGVASYVHLAQELALRGATTYGICALDLCDRKYIPDSLESIVARYVEQLMDVQKNGPYLLVGWSAGAVIAFEMACQLARKDNAVAGVTLLDPPLHFTRTLEIIELPPGHRHLSLSSAQQESARLWWRFVSLNAASVDESGQYRMSTDFWTMDDAGKSKYLFDNRRNLQVIKPHNGLKSVRDAEDMLYMFHTVNIQYRALEDYNPSTYPGTINLFVTSNAEAHNEQLANARLRYAKTIWGRRVGGIAHSELVPGGHIDIVMPPYVANVARSILR